MILKSFYFLTIFTFILNISNSNGAHLDNYINYLNEIWTHSLELEEGRILIEWKNEKDEEGKFWILTKYSAPTLGYLGIGYSIHGGMDGASFCIGYVDDNGNGWIGDYHGVGNGMPIKDSSDDCILLEAFEKGGRTTLVFKRLWNTCDPNDFVITNDTMRLIWAYGDKDDLHYHGGNNRGAKSLFIGDQAIISAFPDEPNGDKNIKQWDVTFDNFLVEAKRTTYHCKIVKFPHADKKVHMTGFKPIITPENAKNVHHLVLYECIVPPHIGKTADYFEEHLEHEGSECYSKNMPPQWGQYCLQFLFVWVVGSEGELYPPHIGTPMGEPEGATYFMMEIHYDNPTLKQFHDSSGVRIFHTNNLREFESSNLLIGYKVSPFMLLPPQQEKFVANTICSSECTQNAIPPEGIKIISTLLHGHLNIRKLKLRHFRKGIELPILAEDKYYDFNYQQSRSLKNEILVLPGDEFVLECEYNTANKTRPVLGGYSTKQEMCQAFLIYYPRLEWTACKSQTEFHDFFKSLGISKVSGEVLNHIKMPYNPDPNDPFDSVDEGRLVYENYQNEDEENYKDVFDYLTIEEPKKLSNQTVAQFFKQINWKDKMKMKKLEKDLRFGNYYSYCSALKGLKIKTKNHQIPYINIEKPLLEDNSVCTQSLKLNSPSSASNSLQFSFAFIIGAILLNFKFFY